MFSDSRPTDFFTSCQRKTKKVTTTFRHFFGLRTLTLIEHWSATFFWEKAAQKIVLQKHTYYRKYYLRVKDNVSLVN